MLKQLLAVLVDGGPPLQRRFVSTLSCAAHPFSTSLLRSSIRSENAEREREREMGYNSEVCKLVAKARFSVY